MTEDESCSNCAFFRNNECRAGRPVPWAVASGTSALGAGPEDGDIFAGVWPDMDAASWCGDHEPDTDPDPFDGLEDLHEAWVESLASREGVPWRKGSHGASPPELDTTWHRLVVYRPTPATPAFEIWRHGDDELWGVREVDGTPVAAPLD